MSDRMIELKATSGFAVDGEVVSPGQTAAVREALAKDLLRRGKAELVTHPAEPDPAPKSKRAAKKTAAPAPATPDPGTDPDEKE